MKKTLLGALLVASALFAQSSNAAYRIEDPNNILDEMRQFLAPANTFVDAFQLDDLMRGETRACRVVCRRGSCNEVCTPPMILSSTVHQVASDEVVLKNQIEGDNSTISYFVLTEDQYTANEGNFLLLYLREGLGGSPPGENDYSILQGFSLEDYTLLDETVIPSMKLRVESFAKQNNGKYKAQKENLRIGKGLPGVAQLLEVHSDPDNLKTPLFKVISVKR